MISSKETGSIATIQDLVCSLTRHTSSDFSNTLCLGPDLYSALNLNEDVGKDVEMKQHQAYASGWLEQQDLLSPTAPLERRTIARIIHMYLCTVMDEQDEADVTVSYQLRDLYDCRVCAGHVMQVYTKGIMDSQEHAPGLHIFGMKEAVTKEELRQIIERAIDSSKRINR